MTAELISVFRICPTFTTSEYINTSLIKNIPLATTTTTTYSAGVKYEEVCNPTILHGAGGRNRVGRYDTSAEVSGELSVAPTIIDDQDINMIANDAYIEVVNITPIAEGFNLRYQVGVDLTGYINDGGAISAKDATMFLLTRDYGILVWAAQSDVGGQWINFYSHMDNAMEYNSFGNGNIFAQYEGGGDGVFYALPQMLGGKLYAGVGALFITPANEQNLDVVNFQVQYRDPMFRVGAGYIMLSDDLGTEDWTRLAVSGTADLGMVSLGATYEMTTEDSESTANPQLRGGDFNAYGVSAAFKATDKATLTASYGAEDGYEESLFAVNGSYQFTEAVKAYVEAGFYGEDDTKNNMLTGMRVKF